MIGKSIAQYKILEKLGEGGMGVVYKALDTKLERFVALKFLPPEVSVSADDRARFLQEARAASAISHANVCVIYDICEYEGQQFIVMEFVDGKTLRQMLPIPKVQDALGYAIQIGEALEEAHSKGIVHRDIKTENVMVNEKNQVKVMDFGLAKLRGSLKLTKTSSTVGTLAYMAPEQIQGGEVDARSDIFSFGVVLYEMLTGHLPFVGEHEAAVIYSILNDSPQPVQKFRPELSSELLHILNRALEKDPEDRYQNVREMVIDLRRAKKETSRVSRPVIVPSAADVGRGVAPTGQSTITAEGVPSALRTSAAGRRGPLRGALLWIVILAVLVVVIAVAIFVVRPQRTAQLNPNMSVRTLPVPFSDIGQYPSFSRDGNWVVFSASDATNEWSIYFMNVAGGSPRRLSTEHFQGLWNNYAEISPDGSQVLFGSYQSAKPRAIFVVSSLGGTSRNIAEPGVGGRWRPDGKLIGYVLGAGGAPSRSGKLEFWTMRPDGTEKHLEFVDSLSYGFDSFCFDWSPDGKSVAWLRSLPDRNEILIHDLKSGKERQLTAYKSRIDEVAWATNNRIFFTLASGGNTDIWMIGANGGKPVQVTKGSGAATGVRVSADGKRLLYTEQRTIHHLWTADIDGKNARQLTFDNQPMAAPSFSPDKRQILFIMYSLIMYSPDFSRLTGNVFVMDSDGTKRIQLTGEEARYTGAAWSPDGKYVAYVSFRFGEPPDSSKVYLVDVSNPGTPRLIGSGYACGWIDSGELSVFDRLPRLHSALYSVDRSKPMEVSQDSTLEIPLADGKHTLFWDEREGRYGWWLKTSGMAQGVAPKRMVPIEYTDSSYPAVSLRYLLSAQANGEMWLVSLPDGRRTRLPEIFNNNKGLQLSYDNKQVVYLKAQPDSRLVLVENLFK